VRRVLVVVVAVAVASGAAAWWTSRDGNSGPSGLVPLQGDFFDRGGRIEPGPFRGAWSPDGTHLLTISARGIGEARAGRVRAVTAPGSRAVDAAWMPGSNALLVAEGPVPTGQLSVLRLDGSSLGEVRLAPSFGVGAGRGMTVDAAGRRAVVTRVERNPFQAQGRADLVLVDLSTGSDRLLVDTASTDEERPFFVGPELVVFTSRPSDSGAAIVAVLDIATNQVRQLSPPGQDASAVGVIADEAWVAYVSGGRLWAVRREGGPSIRLARVPSGTDVVAVHPDGRMALVVERAGPDTATQLHRIDLRPLPSAGVAGADGYGESPWRSTFS
jgi:hypothetical protein